MVTYYVIYDTFSRSFVRAGKSFGWTTSLNKAKHFTSEWSAHNYIERCETAELRICIVKRIERY